VQGKMFEIGPSGSDTPVGEGTCKAVRQDPERTGKAPARGAAHKTDSITLYQ